jgi:hypothetical protein
MAKFIEQYGNVTVQIAEEGDPIYSQGWTIGLGVRLRPSTEAKDNPSKQVDSLRQEMEMGEPPLKE